MSRRMSSKGDWGKSFVYATSHRDSSSNDEIVSISEQASQVLQSHFDRRGDDIRPIGRIPMETRSRRQRSTETVSASSKSRTIYNGDSSRRVLATGRETFGGEMLAEDLLFDIEVDLFGDDMVGPDSSARRRRLRPRPMLILEQWTAVSETLTFNVG